MKHKGPIWAIIFFIILIFILINTLNTQSYFHRVEIDIVSSDGFVADTTITAITQPQEQEGALYQQFHLTTDTKNNKATIDVDDSWMRQQGVAPDSIKLYYQTAKGEPWTEIPLSDPISFSDSSSYTAENIDSGNYYIIGTPGTATIPQPPLDIKVQLGILIVTIIMLLFIAYHHSSSRDIKHHEKKKPGQEQLDKYIKQSLISGHDEQAIKERLQQAGWSEKQVDQGLRRARFL